MKKIPVVSKQVIESDPVIKAQVTNTVLTPETPFSATMIAVTCDGRFYTVYEQGDVIP